MSGEGPSSSVQALTLAPPSEPRALRSSLDELDEDDVIAIGRVLNGHSPVRLGKTIGTSVGLAASIGVAAFAPVVSIGMLVVVAGVVATTGRRDIRADLVGLGLSPDLTEVLLRSVGVVTTVKGMRRWNDLRIKGLDDEDHRRLGTAVVDDARRRRSSANDGPAGR